MTHDVLEIIYKVAFPIEPETVRAAMTVQRNARRKQSEFSICKVLIETMSFTFQLRYFPLKG